MLWCDEMFPDLTCMQSTVVVLRPIVVKTGLHELFEKLYTLNGFIVVKKKLRMLSRQEAIILSKQEGIE